MIRFIFLAIVLIYIQHFSADNISFMNLTPNLFLPFIIYLSIFKKADTALIFAFLMGIVLDLNNPSCFGITTLWFIVLSFVLSYVKKMINKGQIMAYVSVILATNLVFFLGSNLIIFLFQINQIFPFTKILILSFYNTLLSVLIIVFLYYVNKLSIRFKEI